MRILQQQKRKKKVKMEWNVYNTINPQDKEAELSKAPSSLWQDKE